MAGDGVALEVNRSHAIASQGSLGSAGALGSSAVLDTRGCNACLDHCCSPPEITPKRCVTVLHMSSKSSRMKMEGISARGRGFETI